MLPSLLLLLLFGGAAAAVFVWNQRKLARRSVLASQSFREFLEQTGFRVVGAEGADLGRQADLALHAHRPIVHTAGILERSPAEQYRARQQQMRAQNDQFWAEYRRNQDASEASKTAGGSAR